MIETELARLRLLHTIAMKGQYLKQEDLAFILDKKQEMQSILQGIEDTLKSQQNIENTL